jgi:thiol-disulfide isomerase/thioredoxin
MDVRRVAQWAVAFAFASACVAVQAAGLVAEPGRPQPAIKDRQLADLLAQRENAPVVLNFWASWCEPCRAEMRSLQRLNERWRTRGLSVLTIAVADSRDRSSGFLWDEGVVLPLLDDPDQSVARALGVQSLPTTLVLDRNHRIAARGRGAINWDAPAIDEQLRSLLK